MVRGISRFGDDIPTVARITGKIGKTGFGKNISNWAKFDYKPAKKLIFKSRGGPIKKGGMTVVRGKYVVDKTVPFWERRFFTSADDFAKFQSKLKQSGKIIETPVERITAGVGEKGKITEKTIMRRGFKGYKQDYYFKRNIEQIGTRVNLFDDTIDTGYGSFSRMTDNVVPKVDLGDVSRMKLDPWFETVKKSYREGYPKSFTTLESGKQIVDYTTGFGGSGMSKPLPKSWITQMKTGLRQSTEATASLIRRQIPRIKNVGKNFGRKKLGLHAQQFSIPSKMIPEGIEFGTVVGFKIGQASYRQRDLTQAPIGIMKQNQMQRQMNENMWKQAQDLEQKNMSDIDQMQRIDTAQLNLQAQQTVTLMKQIQKQKSMLRPSQKTMSSSIGRYDTPMKTKLLSPTYLEYSTKKERIQKIDFDGFDKEMGYRFRTWKVPTLKDLLGVEI